MISQDISCPNCGVSIVVLPPSPVFCKSCSSRFYVNRDGIVEGVATDPGSKSQTKNKPVLEQTSHRENILRNFVPSGNTLTALMRLLDKDNQPSGYTPGQMPLQSATSLNMQPKREKLKNFVSTEIMKLVRMQVLENGQPSGFITVQVPTHVDTSSNVPPKPEENVKKLTEETAHIERKPIITKEYKKTTTPKRQLFTFKKSDALESLIKSMEPDVSHSSGELVGPVKDCEFLDKRLSHKPLFAWGFFNPYGPTWYSLTLASVPEKSISLLYLKMSHPLNIESSVHGWVKEPIECKALMPLLFSMFDKTGEDRLLRDSPTFIACPSDLISYDAIAPLIYRAFVIADIKGLDEACDKMRKHWLKPWERTSGVGKLLNNFMEQNSLVSPKDERGRIDLMESFANFLEKKEKARSPLTQRSFLAWFKLVTNPDHVSEECKQMWAAWQGAIEHGAKDMSPANAEDGLSFHSDILRHRVDMILQDLDEILPKDQVRMFVMPNTDAPIITLGRAELLDGAAVPVYFISASSSAALDLTKESVFISKMDEETGGRAPLGHTVVGKRTGGFLMVPFMYHMFPSAKEFHRAMSDFLNHNKLEFGLQWVVKDCYVMINHCGKSYTPEDGQKSLNN